MERLGSEQGAPVFADKVAALAVEAAAVAAAVAAARADLGPGSEENGSEVDPSPSELGCWCKDLKESECVKVVKSSAEEIR